MSEFEKVRKDCEKGLVDVVYGQMTFNDVSEELGEVCSRRNPDEIVVVMKKVPEKCVNGKVVYQTGIYITKEVSDRRNKGLVYPIKEE